MERTNMTKVDNRFELLVRYKMYLAWTVAAGYSVEQDISKPRCIFIKDTLGRKIYPLMIEGGASQGENPNTVHAIGVGKLKNDFEHISAAMGHALNKNLRDPQRDKSAQFPYTTYTYEALLSEVNYLDRELGADLKAKAVAAYNTVKLDQLVNAAFDGVTFGEIKVTPADIKSEPDQMVNRRPRR